MFTVVEPNFAAAIVEIARFSLLHSLPNALLVDLESTSILISLIVTLNSVSV